MIKTSLFKTIQLLIIVFFFSCSNENSNSDNLSPSLTYKFEALNNDFTLFSNNTLIQDTNDLNYVYFNSANTEKIIFVKKNKLYPFDIIKINQILNQDVINFYGIQLTELSELKKKVLFESENFAAKKDSLSKLESNLLNTLFCFQKKYDCNDKYILKINSFDLTSILENNEIKCATKIIIYTPKDEETALHIEDNCNDIFVNLFARLEKKDINEKLSFNPLRVELFDTKINQKINGNCSFKQPRLISSLPENIKGNEDLLNSDLHDLANSNLSNGDLFSQLANRYIPSDGYKSRVDPIEGEYLLDSKYDKGFIPGQNQQAHRSETQSEAAQAFNGTAEESSLDSIYDEVNFENAEEITIYLQNESELDRQQNVIQNTNLSNSSLLIKLKINKSSGKDYVEFFPKNITINIKGQYYIVSTSRNDNTKVQLFNLANKYDKQIQLTLDLKNKYGFITYNVSNDGMFYKNVVGGKYLMK